MYLASLHRHKFGVRVEVEPHLTGDHVIEFHDLKEEVDTFIKEELLPLLKQEENTSCEEMAERIAEQVYNTQPTRSVSVSIDEDGECGAIYTLGEHN